MDCSHGHIGRLRMGMQGKHFIWLLGDTDVYMPCVCGRGERECMKVVMCSVTKGTGGGQRQSQCGWGVAYLKQIK